MGEERLPLLRGLLLTALGFLRHFVIPPFVGVGVRVSRSLQRANAAAWHVARLLSKALALAPAPGNAGVWQCL